MNEIRYFVYCPRGFVNERTLMATNKDDIVIKMQKQLDDGMAGTFEEVNEDKAKHLIFKNNIYPDIETAVYNMDDFPMRPKWEDYKKALILNAETEFL